MDINWEELAKMQGERLKKFRKDRKISKYVIKKATGLTGQQIDAIENGTSEYTHKSFLKYIYGSNLYMFFGEKNNENKETHDFKDMEDSFNKNNPEM